MKGGQEGTRRPRGKLMNNETMVAAESSHSTRVFLPGILHLKTYSGESARLRFTLGIEIVETLKFQVSPAHRKSVVLIP